jgi:hypothetical protein
VIANSPENKAPAEAGAFAFGREMLVRRAGLLSGSSGIIGEEYVDALVLIGGEAEVECGRDTFDLLRAATADDGCGDGWVMKRPGDGDNAGLDVMGAADFAEEFHQAEVA